MTMPAIHRHDFTVPEGSVDVNGHVNNVEYLRWMGFQKLLEGVNRGTSKSVKQP